MRTKLDVDEKAMLLFPTAQPSPGPSVNNSLNPASMLGTLDPGFAPKPLLVNDKPVIEHRVSPFSTPPSSDDSLNTDTANSGNPSRSERSSRSVRQAGKPQAAVTSSDVAGMKGGRGRVSQSFESSSIGIPLMNHSNTSKQDHDDSRPKLPPRPDVKSHPLLAPPPKLPTRMTVQISREEHLGPEAVSKTPAKGMSWQERQTDRYRTFEHSSSFAYPPLQTSLVASDRSSSIHVPYSQAPPSSLPYPTTAQSLPGQEGHSNLTSTQAKDPGAFPDSSSPNRRPPYTKGGARIIHTNHDTGSFEMGAGFACCAGQLVRIWDLTSGRLIVSLVPGEKEVRATAQAFKPSITTSEEGSHLWIGTNYGDLQEISVSTHKKVSSRPDVHNGRSIIRILRYQSTMWTLDEDGTLLVWPPSDSGMPSLEGSPIANKVPRGHTFSMVVSGLLWLALGRTIRVFRPSASGIEELSLPQQPSSQPSVGEITSGAVIEGQLDKVYFGHSDGKISVYSAIDYTCLGTMTVSVYRINCLAGAGNFLWAGYNSGKVCIYDTQSSPWKVLKDWHAHEGPVSRLSVDRSSLWMSGLLQVGTLSLDNTIRLWDGLLEDDWLRK
ncbi:MAG: hypothetical protein LQ352_002542 [Teloschistes flavicans]|nr:MAG: hypothetical protein LQ352_002542 [Teloschistes flavicans]